MAGFRYLVIVCLAALGHPGKADTINGRYYHTTTYIKPFIYIQGGRDGGSGDSYATVDYMLNVESGLDVENLSLQTSKGPVPVNAYWSRAVALVPESMSPASIFQIGGDFGGDTDDPQAAIREFTTANSEWRIENEGSDAVRVVDHSAVWSPAASRLFIYGGRHTTNETEILDSFQMYSPQDDKWAPFNRQPQSPPTLARHSAVMINATHMLVCGGIIQDGPAPTNVIYLFNTVSPSWARLTTVGSPPSSIVDATPIVVHNTIIFYGAEFNNNQPFKSLPTLNFNDPVFTWSSLKLPQPHPIKTTYSAVLVGKYLISTFGYNNTSNDEKLRIYDLESVSQVTQVSSQDLLAPLADHILPFTGPNGAGGGASSLSVGAIIGIAIGGAVFLALVILGGFLLHRRLKDRQLKANGFSRRDGIRRADTMRRTMNDLGILPEDVDVRYNPENPHQPVVFSRVSNSR
ncbi:hypothetical protein H4R33_006289 [Dimargaris cristalligena]|nr:hypothetical protein H4R33_006289 [Dimargaris cristalligena]